MNNVYNIVVHVVNLILLVFVGFIGFALLINISAPGPIPNFDILKFCFLVFLLIMWTVNYWYQYYKIKNRKWFLPVIGAVVYLAIAFFVMGVVMPFLYEIVY